MERTVSRHNVFQGRGWKKRECEPLPGKCRAAIFGGLRELGSLDIFSGAVVQNPHAHFLPCGQRIFPDRHAVYLGAKAFVRFQTKTVGGPGSLFMPVSLRLLHPITPKKSIPGRKETMGGSCWKKPSAGLARRMFSPLFDILKCPRHRSSKPHRWRPGWRSGRR